MILLTNDLKAKEREKKRFIPLNSEVVAESVKNIIDLNSKNRQSSRVCKQLKTALTLRSSLLIPYITEIQGFDLGYDVYVDDQGRYYRAESLKSL